MQNTKIQTLWNLCNELKEKRQFLVDRLKSTQDYLDQQQLNLSREVHVLREQNTLLEQNVHFLSDSVQQVWQIFTSDRLPESASSVALVRDFSLLRDCAALHVELHGRFQAQDTILHLLQPEVTPVDAPAVFREAFQELFTEFQEHYELFQNSSVLFEQLQDAFFAGADEPAELAALLDSFRSYIEFLHSFSDDLHGFQAQWQAAVVYRKNSLASSNEQVVLRQEFEQLKEAYQKLEAEKYQREALLAGVFSQSYACNSAFLELQNHHDQLRADLRQLEYALGEFQALQALVRSGSQSEPHQSDIQIENDLFEPSPESDRQAVREALQENTRKRIAQILRRRFGKVPRRVHQLLKAIETSSRLDKCFDLSLETESVEAFSQALE